MLPRDAQILEHIYEYCVETDQALREYDGLAFESFCAGTVLQRAVAFNILQIGELVGKLSDELRASTIQEINWPAIRGMRNVVVHDYGNVALDIVWDAAVNDLPVLMRFCEARLTQVNEM